MTDNKEKIDLLQQGYEDLIKAMRWPLTAEEEKLFPPEERQYPRTTPANGEPQPEPELEPAEEVEAEASEAKNSTGAAAEPAAEEQKEPDPEEERRDEEQRIALLTDRLDRLSVACRSRDIGDPCHQVLPEMKKEAFAQKEDEEEKKDE